MSELSDLFKLVAEEKKRKKDEIESLIGDSFDKLFIDKLKPNKTPEQLAKKHKISTSIIKTQLKKGTKVEKEHTKDVGLATKIASQHIDELPDYYDRLSKIENKPIKEGLLNISPQEKTPDPLTPLNQNFATLDDLQKHYKLFINRIQQQLSTLGGGGETKLRYLDDIVGIATNSGAYNNKFLQWNSITNQAEFVDPNDVGGTTIVNISGITTYYQASNADDYIGVSADVPVTIVLPQIPSYGKKLIVKDEGNKIATYNITVQAGAGTSVENDSSVIMTINHQSFTYFYNGSNWFLI